jgi:UDP-N-acetylglucosamine--N-acetylmuramyl-(pentapeptide) pyrophosphoryl-undecaprenol N-acetylglucosamine transferase
MSDLRILCAAGGTAGHIEPALNLADALTARGGQVSFLGSDRGLESTLVPARGYRLDHVRSVPMPRRLTRESVTFPVAVTRSVRDAQRFVADVDVVVGFGGYAAVPGYVAAWRSKKPLIIHEANARAGFANRLGAKLTPHVLATHPEVLPGAQRMGLPLRPAIASLDRSAIRAAAQEHFGLRGQVVFVFGGSQGAQRLNDAVAAALPALSSAGISVLHAYGSHREAPMTHPGYVPVPYIDRMDLAYAAADLVVSRAGAMTCAELTAVGVPAVYVPLPIGNGEQMLNAAPIVDVGGGLIVTDASLTGASLADVVTHLCAKPATLARMGSDAATLGDPHAAERMADYVMNVGRAQ